MSPDAGLTAEMPRNLEGHPYEGRGPARDLHKQDRLIQHCAPGIVHIFVLLPLTNPAAHCPKAMLVFLYIGQCLQSTLYLLDFAWNG